MSLPEKIYGSLPGRPTITETNEVKWEYEIKECFRYKDKDKLEKALITAQYEMSNNGNPEIHGFLISYAWFTFAGYADGYMGVKEIDKKQHVVHWSVGSETYAEYLKEGKWCKHLDNRPSAAAIREYSGSCSPICYFAGVPVWLLPDEPLWQMKQVVIAIPKGD